MKYTLLSVTSSFQVGFWLYCIYWLDHFAFGTVSVLVLLRYVSLPFREVSVFNAGLVILPFFDIWDFNFQFPVFGISPLKRVFYEGVSNSKIELGLHETM